jgi:hypothetical protein
MNKTTAHATALKWLPRPRPWSASGAAMLLAAAIGFAGPATGQSISSYAVSYGSDSGGPVTPDTSSTPGALVHQDAKADAYISPLNSYYGTAFGSASAASDYGVARAAASGQFIGLNTTEHAGFAFVNSTAQSQWTDTWKIDGGTWGDPVSITLTGRTSYHYALGGGALIDTLSLWQSVYAIGYYGDSQLTFDTSTFAANAALGYFDWTLTLSTQSGDTVNVGMFLSAAAQPAADGAGEGATDKTVEFDAMHTAVLERTTLTDGYAISAASGELVEHDGALVYRAVLTVPEPATWSLMLLGFGGLGFGARSRAARV